MAKRLKVLLLGIFAIAMAHLEGVVVVALLLLLLTVSFLFPVPG
jgi:hypothetical protein